MFDSLSEKLQAVFDRLGRKGRLGEEDVEAALREVRIALLEADVSLKVVRQFVAAIKEKAVGQDVLHSLTPAQTVIKIVHDQLVELLGTSPPRLAVSSKPPTVIMLVGLQGSGKTTTAAKLAVQIRKMGHKPLLVAADPYRPAAVTQLQTLGKQIDVPVFHEPNKKPPELAQAAVKHAEQNGLTFVVVDTAGRTAIDEAMMREIRELHAALQPIETLFVVDSMQGQDAVNTARAFREALPLTGVVLTKLDGDARGGAALSVRQVTGAPIKFAGVAEKISGLEVFHPERMASRILGMGDVLTLIEEAHRTVDVAEAKKFAKKVKTGKGFDLEDYKQQVVQMRKMGGFSAMLDKLPAELAKAAQGAQVDERKIARVEGIINSMTREERTKPELIKASRKRRIAAGSGVSVQEVNQLLNQFEQAQKMMKMVAKGGMQKMLRAFGGRK